MSLSLLDIFSAVARTKGSAEGFAQSHPQHSEAVSRFIQDLHQISLGLQTASRVEATFQSLGPDSMMEAELPDIVGGLSAARVFATIISEQQPDYAVPLKRFQEEALRVQRELIQKIYPGSLSEED